MNASASQPYTEIVVGTDGSETAERAVGCAATLALALDVPLTIATAWYRDMPDKPVMSEIAQMPAGSAGAMEAGWAEMSVSDGAAIARKTGAEDPDVLTPQGHPADALLDVCATRPEALLVVGTAGLGSATERLLGNVPHQISHHATTDVLLVRTDPGAEASYQRVGLATDGSPTAQIAVTRGLGFARALGAEPVLLTAARDQQRGEETLDRVLETLDDPDPASLGRLAVEGRDVVASLLASAGEFDVLVIGNKGMSGPSRLLGSVANRITHRVPTDLLLVNTVGRRS
jgi:nucleotide-binding universal stress UspA family protein